MQSKFLLIFVIVFVLALAFGLFVFPSISPTPINSGIKGIVLIGPTCPVETIPPQPNCGDKPFQAKIFIKNSNGFKVGEFSSGINGKFEVPLSPGTYVLEPQSPNVLPSGQIQTVIVEEGKFTQITINYDSGIR
ncbi:MAG: hypothetical protein Q7S21_03060 [archaeon]|nr:hypothetical protein [archaeon]